MDLYALFSLFNPPFIHKIFNVPKPARQVDLTAGTVGYESTRVSLVSTRECDSHYNKLSVRLNT
jgi:hypothetical protein